MTGNGEKWAYIIQACRKSGQQMPLSNRKREGSSQHY